MPAQAACLGLVESATWDDPPALRGEIYAADQLADHAVIVARSHGTPTLGVRPGPLRKRFADARTRLSRAYEVLSRSLSSKQDRSPAEEWLLDNSHVIEEQIREIDEDLPWGYLVELPRLANGTMRGFPRVYGLCLDYLRHTDGRVDLHTLASYVTAYQTADALTIGELWAIPIMLRLGLVLAVSALASSEASARDRERGDVWAGEIIAHGQTSKIITKALAELEREDAPVTPALIVEIARRIRDNEAPLVAAVDWVTAQAAKLDTTPDELVRKEHLQEAANQVSVGNAITSMRAINALDWNAFFEETSGVEAELRRDPAEAYAAMDIATRDRYRHAVERLARRSTSTERNVARVALSLASASSEDPARKHVGYWLVGDGRPELARKLAYQPRIDERLRSLALAHPAFFYLGAISFITAAECAAVALALAGFMSPGWLAVMVVLFAPPATEIAIAITNALVVATMPPRILPKMSFEKGIPDGHRTLVVVPALLERAQTVHALLESLEIRSLSNLDENLHFALLTDFCDHDGECHPDDDALLALARDGIAELNARIGPGANRYMLFHRKRLHNPTQGTWMGWERKRGKLEELNRLLRGDAETTFSVVTAPPALLADIRYVITLDADTDLPRDVAQKLVGTIAHPLNRPRLGANGRVVSGHAVVQPRVGTLPVSSRRTRYARFASTALGIDPYTTAVSDVYQDLFGEGSYVGKGIYDVDAFKAALDGRVPDNTLLSHDLFEGIFARSALASDIEVLDEQPTSYEVAAKRQHRWIRGDWQMLPWLVSGGLRMLDRWKIADNLRRSLLAPGIIAALAVAWLANQTATAAWATATLLAIFLVPVLARAVISATRTHDGRAFVLSLAQSALRLLFLLDEAVVAVDAIVRTLHRVLVSRKRLLEWTPMARAERQKGEHSRRRLVVEAGIAAAALVAAAVWARNALPFAAPMLLAWAAAPAVASYLRQPEPRKKVDLKPSEREMLRLVAQRTWHFFETFVTESEHHLPPDNFQEDPQGVVAHRTSPTNIGLYLLSVVAAWDFGFISLQEVVTRLDATLSTIEKLERRNGHLLNWYETTTLKPLEPQYVSTVDSGNLAAFLWTLREACAELANTPDAPSLELRAIGQRAGALADAMSFGFLFDTERKLFSIGCNMTNARLDGSHYDLLASEARVASLVAIAKGEAPQEHWFRMGRPHAATTGSRRVLLSWSGSMFEYLMPLLVTKTFEHTLLDETYASAVRRQIAYGAENGVPWGVSESAYNVMDLGMTYQYRAFGVPGLGLKAGLGEDLVIAPYASALAAMLVPHEAAANLRALERLGALGTYGFYDAVDCTPGHLPPGRKSAVVKTFMAHHEGMTLVALDNVLNDSPMQRRFHADLRVKSVELLLEERIPTRTPLTELRQTALRVPVLAEPELDVVEHIGLGARPPRLHLLGHGELSTAVTVRGEGFTTWKDIDVYRFREDDALEAGGIFVYLRDKKSGAVWSAGYAPTKVEPSFYDAALAIDRIEITRRDGDIETVTEIVVSPERPADVRRITLTNHGREAREIELTTYTEVVLAPRDADLAHRAFVSMFIETEALTDKSAVLAHRRPKSGEPERWVAQVLWPEGDAWLPSIELDTSRASFLGRGRTTEDPVGVHGPLAGNTGAVLDPALAIRRTVRLAPGAHARITLATALATTRGEAVELVDRYATPHIIPRAFELAWTDARVELKHLGVTAAQSHRFQRLLSAVMFPQAALRESPDRTTFQGRGRSGLWAQGLTNDVPIVLVRLDSPDFSDLVGEVLLAHEFWRLNGVTVDLVALNEEASGYLQPQQEALMSLVRSGLAAGHVDQRGGVFIRRARDMSDEDRALLFANARVVLRASRGSLARQLHEAANDATVLPEKQSHSRAVAHVDPPHERAEARGEREVAFDNGIGGFEKDGGVYALTITPGQLPPKPWSNVIANANFGTLITESGASFTWSGNSQRHRITPWSNDPVCDPSGELFFIRDDDDGTSYSLTPLPAGGDATFTVRHAPGWSSFEHARGQLEHEVTVFVSPTDAVKTTRIRITNRGKAARHLSVFGIVEWVLGATRDRSRLAVITDWNGDIPALIAQNPLSLRPERHAFFTASRAIASYTGDRREIFGICGSRARPCALERVALSNRVAHGLDPCGALQVAVTIAAGETTTISFVLGEGDDANDAEALARKHRTAEQVTTELTRATDVWDGILGAIVVKTPDPAIDALVNHWLLYQVASCRVWGRSAFYQSGGAYGFRDQIQDVLALVHARPDLTREHLLRAAARQFVEGDVQHWWHADTGEGVRTRCSDDMLWLPYAVSEYVGVTGDTAILDCEVPFLSDRKLTDTDDDLFGTPSTTKETSSLYEHCTRALDIGATSGRHGLPKMGGGDWNDGMSRVGRGGEGESVWLAWFLARTALDFISLATHRRDDSRVVWCRDLAARLGRAADEHAWDGDWYRRGFFDDGTPLGSHVNAECQIDAIAQSWAVIAGVGDPERAARALRSSEDRLVRTSDALMRLLWPPFVASTPDPGYIRAYPAGIRENGGQYTHGVMWTVCALATLGQGDRAISLLSLLNPIHHASSREGVARYEVEPYVVSADVYDAVDHVGRGGWSWYTGSASWMYRVIVENILGVHREGQRVIIDPRIAKAWPRFEITLRDGEGHVHIVVENPRGLERGAPTDITLTGAPGTREIVIDLGHEVAESDRSDAQDRDS